MQPPGIDATPNNIFFKKAIHQTTVCVERAHLWTVRMPNFPRARRTMHVQLHTRYHLPPDALLTSCAVAHIGHRSPKSTKCEQLQQA